MWKQDCKFVLNIIDDGVQQTHLCAAVANNPQKGILTFHHS